MTNFLENFKRDLAEVTWRDLRIHLQRDALIVVSSDLDLVNAAMAVAGDDSMRVNKWIAEGSVCKPTAAQLEAWEKEPSRSFLMLIVQPFILIQDVAHD